MTSPKSTPLMLDTLKRLVKATGLKWIQGMFLESASATQFTQGKPLFWFTLFLKTDGFEITRFPIQAGSPDMDRGFEASGRLRDLESIVKDLVKI